MLPFKATEKLPSTPLWDRKAVQTPNSFSCEFCPIFFMSKKCLFEHLITAFLIPSEKFIRLLIHFLMNIFCPVFL